MEFSAENVDADVAFRKRPEEEKDMLLTCVSNQAPDAAGSRDACPSYGSFV